MGFGARTAANRTVVDGGRAAPYVRCQVSLRSVTSTPDFSVAAVFFFAGVFVAAFFLAVDFFLAVFFAVPFFLAAAFFFVALAFFAP